MITFLFAAIYKILPDVRLQWSDVAVGASVTSLLFTIGKQLIGLYLGKASFGSTYGAAGSLVADWQAFSTSAATPVSASRLPSAGPSTSWRLLLSAVFSKIR